MASAAMSPVHLCCAVVSLQPRRSNASTSLSLTALFRAEGEGKADGMSVLADRFLEVWDCKNPCDAVALNFSQPHAPTAQAHRALHWHSQTEVLHSQLTQQRPGSSALLHFTRDNAFHFLMVCRTL